MLENETARSILQAYHDSTADQEDAPTPLMILHGLREEITVRPHIELPSAYHMAHYVDEFVSDRTVSITVCGRFFKQIGERVFQGTILYHVDRIGSHLIRGIDMETGQFFVLDDSPYWNKFPYDFDDGPMQPEGPIGFHPGDEDDDPAVQLGGWDEDDQE